MTVSTSQIDGVAVVHVHDARLTYPMLSDFVTTVTGLIGRGEKKLVLDLSPVTYVDSATIGCLMDLFRQATAADGQLKLAGVQQRVATMLTMTGAHNFLEAHADTSAAIASFGD